MAIPPEPAPLPDNEHVDLPGHDVTDMSSAENTVHIGAAAHVGQIAVGSNIQQVKYVGYTAQEVDILLARIRTDFQPKAFDGRSPYVGLASFREQDADRFFGRETLIQDLLGRVQKSRCIVIAGPSGSGKSSLVRAGLIPALKKGRVPDSQYWLYGTLKPGRTPLDELGRVAAGLAKAPKARQEIQTTGATNHTLLHDWAEIALDDDPARRAVILVDQFEEIFTQVPREHEEERVAFLNLLTYAAMADNGRVLLLLTLRSDFVSNCSAYPVLNALINQQFLQVGAMTSEELVSAIARPAYQVGLRMDPALIAQVVNDVGGEPGALPLMQFALQDLFEAEKNQGELTLDGYLTRGGLHKALERHADAEFAKLDDAEKELARTVFSGLIEIGRGTQDTKRTALFDELVPVGEDSARVSSLVSKLTDARLLTTDIQEGKARTVTLAHEKLIDAWDWLRRLVNENREAIALQNEIAQDAQDWDQAAPETRGDYLYRGARLATAQEKLEQNKLVLSGLADAFIAASTAAREETLRQEQAQRQRELDAAKQIAEQAQALAQEQQQRAEVQEQARRESERLNRQLEHQLRVSDARRLAVQAVSAAEQDPGQALLLAVEAMRRDDSLEVRNSFLRVLNSHPQLRQYLTTGDPSLVGVTFSPDGAQFATGDANGTIQLWNVETLQPTGKPMPAKGEGGLAALAFSPDSSALVAIASGGTIARWNVETQAQLKAPRVTRRQADCFALSPDARLAAFGKDGTITLIDTATHRPVGTRLVRERPDPITMFFQNLVCLGFNADASLLAAGYRDGLIIIWDVKTFTPRGEPLTSHQTTVNSRTSYLSPYQKQVEVKALGFGADGLLLSGDSNGTILVHKPGSTGENYSLDSSVEHDTAIMTISADLGGKNAAIGDLNGRILLWSMDHPESLRAPLLGHATMVTSMAWHPTIQNMLLSCSQDATIVWDLNNDRWVGAQVSGRSDTTRGIGFTRDDQLVRFVEDDGLVHVLDVLNGAMLEKSFVGLRDDIRMIALHPDGSAVAALKKDDSIILADLKQRTRTGRIVAPKALRITYSRVGAVLASQSWDRVLCWDLTTQKQICEFEFDSLLLMNEPAADALQDLVPVPGSDSIILIDARNNCEVGQLQSVYLTNLACAVLSPNAPVLAVGKKDGTVLLWDTRNNRPIVELSLGVTTLVQQIAFNRDGTKIAAFHYGGIITLWEIDVQVWLARARQIANRTLTRDEWEQFVKSGAETFQDYHPFQN